MTQKLTVTILLILLVGVVYRLVLTSNGNFLFNMDNAQNMVEVREMVVLHKLRLTGGESAIRGFFYGPAWYYLLAIPFILSHGDPYASILMEIGLWAVGGFFLLKLVSKWGGWLVFPVGAIWVASDYIVLANRYAFSPNPVILLSPVFIYLLVEYLKKRRAVYIISAWFLAGLFFNFEMNFGMFTPLVIVASIVLTKNIQILRQKWFWVGAMFFIFTLLPQVIFDFKHQFIMSQAILRHFSEDSGSSLNVLARFQIVASNFYKTFLPILMNHTIFTWIVLASFVPVIYGFIKTKQKEVVTYVSITLIFLPFFMFLVLHVQVSPWHLGGEMAAALILVAFLLKKLRDAGVVGKFISTTLSVSIIGFALSGISNSLTNEIGKPSPEHSLYRNEISAIDYVYKYATGQNFKAYAYLPSVYDYPYQYLFWWYGQKKYGYLPMDYAYAPNKPPYIPGKESFSETAQSFKQRKNSNLVFLIKEPNRDYTRFGWEGDFVNLESIGKQMVGPIEIEIKKELEIKN